MVSLKALEKEGLSPLAYFGYVFDQAEIEASFVPADGTIPVDQLLVRSGQDIHGDDLIIKILFAEDVAQSLAQKTKQTITPAPGSTLQFLLLNPLKLERSQIPDLQHLSGVLNRLSLLGYFGAHVQDGWSLSYQLMGHTRLFEPSLLVRVLNGLSGNYRYFQPYFDACLKQAKSLDAILQEVAQI